MCVACSSANAGSFYADGAVRDIGIIKIEMDSYRDGMKNKRERK